MSVQPSLPTWKIKVDFVPPETGIVVKRFLGAFGTKSSWSVSVVSVWALKYGLKATSSRFNRSVSLESLSKDERRSGAPKNNFRKIYVRKTICDLEFSEHLL